MEYSQKLTWEMFYSQGFNYFLDRIPGLLPFLFDPKPLKIVAFETTTRCTRKCVYCPPHYSMNIPGLCMSMELYNRVIDSLSVHDFRGKIYFSLYGDPLLDDMLESRINTAKAKLPGAEIVVFTNGDMLTVDKYLSLKKSGLDVLVLSQHSRELNGKVLETLNILKKDYPGLYCIYWMDYYKFFYVDGNKLGVLNNKGGLADVRRKPFLHCCDAGVTTIDCLGNVLLCLNDCTSSYVFGNAGEKDIYEIWNDRDFLKIRRAIVRGQWLFEICRNCMSSRGLSVPVPEEKDTRLPRAFHDFNKKMSLSELQKQQNSRQEQYKEKTGNFKISFLFRILAVFMLLPVIPAAIYLRGPSRLSAIFFLVLFALFYYLYCLFRLKELSVSGGLYETANFALGPGSILVGPLQHRAEILPFLKECFPDPPSAALEIGRAKGGTLALLCSISAPDAVVISLDIPGGAWSGSIPLLAKGAWRLPLLNAMKKQNQKLHIIDGDSKSPSSLARVKEALSGRKLDLLFIDGDHTFDGVLSDFEIYSQFVRPGGIIAFHDINPGLEKFGVEVHRFWREFPLPGSRTEFIENPSQISCGIGVLRLPIKDDKIIG